MNTDNIEHLLTKATTEHEVAERNWHNAILYARTRGMSVRRIAEIAGIAPQTVLNIYGRITASNDSPA